MDMQNVSNLQIPEGDVRTIHDKDNRLLWGRVAYNTKYVGNIIQNGAPTPDDPFIVQTVTGRQVVTVSGGGHSNKYYLDLYNNLALIPDGNYTSSGIDWLIYKNVCIGTGNPSRTYSFVIFNKTFASEIPAGTYTYSIDEALPSPYQVELSLYDSNSNRTNYSIPVGEKSVTITRTSTSKMFNLALINATVGSPVNVTINNPKLVSSDSVIELCKIGDYQDYIYKSGDDWYLHKETGKVILTGSLFTRVNIFTKVYQIPRGSLSQFSIPAGDISSKCDYFHCVTSGTPAIGEFYAGENYLNFNYDNDPSDEKLPTFRNWVDANKPLLYSVLATPTDAQITDATLISQLDAIHEWLTRYGYNATVTGNLPLIVNRTNL